jgi:hypothetical protein
MRTEHDFYRELSSVPALPSDLFSCIDRRIRRRSLLQRSLIALAASLLFSVGLFGFIVKQQAATRTLQPEIVAELQSVHDYLNAGDIEDDYVLYTGIYDY